LCTPVADVTFARLLRASQQDLDRPTGLEKIFLWGYIWRMTWDVEYTDEFGDWWASLTEAEQVSLAASVQLLEARGPSLGHPRRMAILLIGGDKTGDDRWYEVHVPIADQLYDEHLEQLRREGKN
jgi:hypothetical protein